MIDQKNADEPKRPYYVPPKPKRAHVIPVIDWKIAWALFRGRDEHGKIKPPNT